MTTPETLGAAQEPGQPVPPSPAPSSDFQPAPAPQGVQPEQPKAKRNTLALVSFITAVVGFIFACIPGALILGWVLLPIAFVLSIVSLFMKGRGKGLGVAGLILSIVGTIVASVVFMVAVAGAVDDALSNGDVVAEQPAQTEGSEEGAAAEGTRDNPYPIGTTITNDEWKVTVNSVTLDATDAVMAENEFNDPPADGYQYILVNATLTYVGTSEDGSMPDVSFDYVTATGETVDQFENWATGPDELDTLSTLYNGGTVEGNRVLSAPTESVEDGVLAVTPGIFGDKVFFAVK